MKEIIKLIAALTLVSAIAGLTIGMANIRTKEGIEKQMYQARQSAIEAVLPAGVTTERGAWDILPDKYWTASYNDKLIGYAFELGSRGYEGDIRFMVGVGVDGTIFGVTVLSHNETPGLGSRVNEVASTKYIWNPFGASEQTKPWFTEQFEGLSAKKRISIDKTAGEWHKLNESARSELKSRNAVTAITGSTITTRAFTQAIGQKAAAYLQELGGYCCPETRKRKEQGKYDN